MEGTKRRARACCTASWCQHRKRQGCDGPAASEGEHDAILHPVLLVLKGRDGVAPHEVALAAAWAGWHSGQLRREYRGAEVQAFRLAAGLSCKQGRQAQALT